MKGKGELTPVYEFDDFRGQFPLRDTRFRLRLAIDECIDKVECRM